MGTNGNDANATALIVKVFELLDAHDLDALAAFWDEDVVEEWPIVGRVQGRAALLGHFRNLFDTMPNFRIEMLRTASEGETVFVHWRMTGSFSRGSFLGILATGRSIDMRGTDCLTVRDGKIVSGFIAFDGMTFGTQLGVLPPHGSFADRMMTSAVNVLTRVKSLRSDVAR